MRKYSRLGSHKIGFRLLCLLVLFWYLSLQLTCRLSN